MEGMVYNPGDGRLYWTSAGGAAVLGAPLWALGAGARGELVVALGAGARPRGIDVDPCEARLYFSNWNESRPAIQRAHTSGRGLHAVISTDILMPNALALDRAARLLYWADARLDRLERAHYDGSHRALLTRRGADHVFGLAARGGRLYWTEWVSRAVWTSDARGLDVTQLRVAAHRPMGIVVVTPHQLDCQYFIWIFENVFLIIK